MTKKKEHCYQERGEQEFSRTKTFDYTCNDNDAVLVQGRLMEKKREKFDDGRLLKVRSGQSSGQGKWYKGGAGHLMEGWTGCFEHG